MKQQYWLLLIFGMCMFAVCCKTRSAIESPDDIAWATLYLKGALKDTVTNRDYKDTIIQNRQTAIEIAEPILIKRYGKSTIQKQKPFTVNHIQDYWILRGYLQSGGTAGTFIMILRATDAKIIEMTIRQ